jgi:hypothetical protein
MALVAVLAFLAFSPAVGASPAGRSANFPARIDLPNGFFPEGIERGHGTSFFVGSLLDGAIWRGDFRTGTGALLAAGAPGRASQNRVRGPPRPDLGRRRRAAARRQR